MPDVIDRDALAFAAVRAAHFEPPQQVADDLLAAAAEPDTRLAGVTPAQARRRAANILMRAGKLDAARNVLQSSPDTAGSLNEDLIRAAVLVGEGDISGAEALVGQVRWPVSNISSLGAVIALLLCAAEHGYFELGLRWADAAHAAAVDAEQVASTVEAKRIVTLLRLAGDQVRELQRQAGATGVNALQQPNRERELARAQIAESQPWPALVDGCLLWWPAAEYERLVRQAPQLRDVVGASWHEHTARVQHAMTAFQLGQLNAGGGQLWLVHADFSAYVQFLDLTRADPRVAAVMTAFTSHSGPGHRWPPRRRAACWCGSGRKYGQCCEAN
jgi:hypothetical protein